MSHEHHHHASPALSHLNRAFIIGIVLNLGFVIVEFGAGLIYDSMGLISDAGHNLSDVISLLLALFAFKLSKIKPNARYTYGYKKSTILVSLLNACILLVAVGIIFTESIGKLRHPQPIEGGAIAWVAGIGILINAFTAYLFMKDRKKDLNIKGAYLHMVADTLVSVGVMVSGIVIGFTGWYAIDPIIGMAVAVIILVSTARLLLDSLRLSLDGVPAGIDGETVRTALLEKFPCISGIHHMHIWAISTTENALTAHIVVGTLDRMEQTKHEIKHELEHLGIQHATLEFEMKGVRCEKCDCRE